MERKGPSSNSDTMRRQLNAFKARVITHKHKLDFSLRYYVRIPEAAVKRSDNVEKQLAVLSEESKTLNHELAGIGLSHCLKMSQLKLKYQLEIDEIRTGHEMEFVAMALLKRKAIRKLQTLVELRKRIQNYLVQIYYHGKMLLNH